MSTSTRAWGLRVITTVGTLWVAFWTLAVLAWWSGFKIVHTPSVPLGVYRAHALPAQLKHGDYVCLEAWRPAAPLVLKQAIEAGLGPRDWLEGEALMKFVGAVAGDRIEYKESAITVNGVPLPSSTILEQDGSGVRLPHPTLPRVLGPNEVWLASTHARGFDSRYYGPVDVKSLACKSELLWAW